MKNFLKLIFSIMFFTSFPALAQDENSKKEAMSFLQQGGVAYMKENYKEAADFYHKFIMAQKVKKPNSEAMALFQQGSLAYMNENYLNAADLYLKAGMMIGKSNQNNASSNQRSTAPARTVSDSDGDSVPDLKVENTRGDREASEEIQERLSSQKNRRQINDASSSISATGMTIAEAFKIGEEYYFGLKGRDKDYNKAHQWLKIASDAGHGGASNLLFYIYGNGMGVSESKEEGLRYLKVAADQGHPKSQGILGRFYYLGVDLPKDLQKSFIWSKLAADQNYAPSQQLLGILFIDKTLYEDDDFIHNMYPEEYYLVDKDRLRRLSMNGKEGFLYTAIASRNGDVTAKKMMAEYIKIYGNEQLRSWIIESVEKKASAINKNIADYKQETDVKYSQVLN